MIKAIIDNKIVSKGNGKFTESNIRITARNLKAIILNINLLNKTALLLKDGIRISLQGN